MPTLEAPATPLFQQETPEATLARLVAMVNEYAPSEMSLPRFAKDGRSPDEWSVPVIAPSAPAIGIAAVRNTTTRQKPMQAADTLGSWEGPKAVPSRTGLSYRLSLHSATFKKDESYKGMRRNYESLGKRLGRVGRRLGCIVLGTAVAFTTADTLMNHLNN
jgi:hypothetical protein